MTRLPLGVCAVVALLSVGCDDIQRPTYPVREEAPYLPPAPTVPAPQAGWFYHTGTDYQGRHYAQVLTSALPNVVPGEVMYLVVRCREGAFEVAFDPGFHLGHESDIRYSIDGSPVTSATWGEGAGWLLYQPGSPIAFAELLARSTSWEVTARGWERTGVTVESTAIFQLNGLARHLPTVRSMCGV